MMRLTPLLFSLLVLVSNISQAADVGNPATNAKPKATNKSNKVANSAAKNLADGRGKHLSNGFSFVVEARPAWVEEVQPDPKQDAEMAASQAALQISLNDEQIKVEAKQHQHYQHIIYKIKHSAALGPASQIQIGFDPAYQELAIHKIDVLRDGQRINKLAPKRVQLLQRETQLEARLYDGRVTASIVLDDVRNGDTIDYAYTVRGSNPVFNGKFSHLDYTHSPQGPTATYSLRVIMPENRSLQHRAPNNMQVQTLSRAGNNEWLFSQSALPQHVSEEGSPVSADMGQLIQLSEFGSWQEVAAWGEQLFTPVGGIAESVAKQAASWSHSANTPAQKLQLALDLVQKEVRYFGTEIGVNSHLPNLPEKVLAQRFGDCKDKTALLMAFLKAQQIKARPVLVSTTFKGATASLLPSPLAFNHVIAEVEIDGKKYFLDGTRSHQGGPFAQRQTSDFGKVLLADAQAHEFTSVPDVIKEVQQSVEDHFKLDNMSQDPLLVSTITYYGESAEGMRQAISRLPLAEVQKQISHMYLEAYPQIMVRNSMRVEEVSDKNALRLILEFNLKRFWEMGKFPQIHAGLAFWSLKQLLRHPQDASRNSAWEIGLPGIYQHSIIADFAEEVLTPAKQEKNTSGQANFTVQITSEASTRRATWQAQLRHLGHTVKATQWRSFTEKVAQVRRQLDPALIANLLTHKQIAELDKEVEKFDSSSRNQTKALHATANAAVIISNKLLASARLSPDLQAKILGQRAINLQTLGRYDESATDLQRALALSSDDNVLLAEAAKLAFARGEDAQVKEYLLKSLQLAPHDHFALYIKLVSDYSTNNHSQVKSAADSQLAQNNENGHELALWRYLAARRSGADGKADLQALLQEKEVKHWPLQMGQFFLGQSELKPILKQLDASDGSLEAISMIYFFSAEKRQLDGDLAGAREHWNKVIETGLAHRPEYMIAKRRLVAHPA